MAITVEEIESNGEYECIKELSYHQIKPFIVGEISHKTLLLRLYSIVQVIALVLFSALLIFFSIQYFRNEKFGNELINVLLSIIFSFTFLIPIHEGLHALAFILLGKKNIGFGAQWSKFLFYAEANRQVLNRREMIYVAFAPLLVVTLTGIVLAIVLYPLAISFLVLGITLIHFLFCAGDMAIVSFFQRHLPDEVFTYDDREEKKTYYYRLRR